MNKPVISIFGGSIIGNRGAESMLVTTIGEVRQRFPNTAINVFSYLFKHDRELISDDLITVYDGRPLTLVKYFFSAVITKLFPSVKFSKGFEQLKKSDLLLDISGISFADGRTSLLLFNVFNIWPALILKIPVAKLSQSLGSFANPINRITSKIYLSKCSYLFARGLKSFSHLKDLGIEEEKYELSSDIAFLFKPEYSLSIENEEKVNNLINWVSKRKELGGKIVSISPSSLVMRSSGKKGHDYLGKIQMIISELAAQNTSFVIFPNASREDSDKPMNNDLVAIKKLRVLVSTIFPEELSNRIFWADFGMNSLDIRRLMTRTNLLIASRFHAMIGGLSNCVPCMIIGWGYKYNELMSDFYLEDYVHDYLDEAAEMAKTGIYLLENFSKVKEIITRELPKVIKLSQKQFEYVEKQVS